jgi:RES domain-containing protein
MKVYRIVREKYLDSVLSGKGAQFSEGFRWNSFGTPLVYTAESRSLAVLEIAVHLDLSEDLPKDRFIVEIDIPDNLKVLILNERDLPKNWSAKPPERGTQVIGDNFAAEAKAAVLSVPSSIIPEERNYLLNPSHSDFSKITARKPGIFHFDSRLGFSA